MMVLKNGDEESEEETEGTVSKQEGGETAREAMTEWNAHENEDMFISAENQISFVTDLSPIYKQRNYRRGDIIGYKDVQNSVYDWLESSYNRFVDDALPAAKWTAKKLVDKNKKIVNHMAKGI
jgi:hypothetical protein